MVQLTTSKKCWQPANVLIECKLFLGLRQLDGNIKHSNQEKCCYNGHQSVILTRNWRSKMFQLGRFSTILTVECTHIESLKRMIVINPVKSFNFCGSFCQPVVFITHVSCSSFNCEEPFCEAWEIDEAFLIFLILSSVG